MDAVRQAARDVIAARESYRKMRAEYLAAVKRGHGGVVLEAEVARVLGIAGERWADALSAYDDAAAAAGVGIDETLFVA